MGANNITEGAGPMVLRSSPSFKHSPTIYPVLIRLIKTNFSQAQESRQPLRDFKLITAYRRNHNLKDSLVHTALDRNKIDSEPWLLHYLLLIFNEASSRGFPICQKLGTTSSNVVVKRESITQLKFDPEIVPPPPPQFRNTYLYINLFIFIYSYQMIYLF